MRTKYRVTTGIYEGYEFWGYEFNSRIYDLDTAGRSYPVNNCEKIK